MCQHFSLLWEIADQGWLTKRKIMSIQGVANWMGQVDPLRRTAISQTRKLLRILRTVPMNAKLILDNRMRSAMARWIHLTNNIVHLGLPEPTQIIQ